MNKKTTKEKISIMQAFEDGKVVDSFNEMHPELGWQPIYHNPEWNWHSFDYRVRECPPKEPCTHDCITASIDGYRMKGVCGKCGEVLYGTLADCGDNRIMLGDVIYYGDYSGIIAGLGYIFHRTLEVKKCPPIIPPPPPPEIKEFGYAGTDVRENTLKKLVAKVNEMISAINFMKKTIYGDKK